MPKRQICSDQRQPHLQTGHRPGHAHAVSRPNPLQLFHRANPSHLARRTNHIAATTNICGASHKTCKYTINENHYHLYLAMEFLRFLVRPLVTTVFSFTVVVVHAQTTVTDLAGRQVRIPARVERILLGESRLLPALAILEGDPSQRLVAMMGDMERVDPASYAQWRTRFPGLDDIARIGRSDAKSFSDERALALRPQVAIFTLGGGHTPGERDRETLARLEAANIAVVFVDFRRDPLRNTPRSMELLGKVLGKNQRAADFNHYWKQQLDIVSKRLQKKQTTGPTVFLENRVGLATACCETMTGLLGKVLDAAGGQNMAKGLLPGEYGLINPELLIARQPQIYIGTGIGSTQTLHSAPQRIALGAGVTPELARKSLLHALRRPQLQSLQAVRHKRAYAIWHHFYNSPFNVVALQVMAKWMHPDLFADIDPQQTLREMYRRFQPLPLNGTYWIDAGH
ncbi:MAG: ABC transporter substrate-binding protein [Brachymonas sp.]|nr:ABC transporter substrate-binding protein [Brachymonas sp.]